MKNVIILSILILCLLITIIFPLKKFNLSKTVISYSVNTLEYIGYKTSGCGSNNVAISKVPKDKYLNITVNGVYLENIHTKEEYDLLNLPGDVMVWW